MNEPKEAPKPVAWVLRYRPTGQVCGWTVAEKEATVRQSCVWHNEDTEDSPYDVIPLYALTPEAAP